MSERFLFVQLPLLDHGYNYILGNIPYGPACIAAYIARHHAGTVTVEYLPWVLANFASNEVIIDYILKNNPDTICFSCYLWNVERSTYIAERIKETVSAIKILFGGPEVHEESWVLSRYRPFIDAFVAGEGEWFFENLLNRADFEKYTTHVKKNVLIAQPRTKTVPIELLSEPLTNRFLDPMPDGSTFIEMVRGCPYKCAYCYYSKNCPGIREFPFTVLSKAIEMRSWMNLKEIYILAPTFNHTSDFKEKLHKLSKMKHGIKLHTEMRTEGIGDSEARLLYRAGFRSLEIGLQTLTRSALKQVNRTSRIAAELEGMHYLKKAGIDLKIGLIPGLPGDTKPEFKDAILKLKDLGFSENLEIYYLMMLPGTKIRELAIDQKVKFLDRPPYYLIEGWGFGPEDIKDITEFCNNERGYTDNIETIPEFGNDRNGTLIGRVFINSDEWDRTIPNAVQRFVQTSVFDIHISGGNVGKIFKIADKVLKLLPRTHQLYNIIINSDKRMEEALWINLLFDHETDSILRRMSLFHDWKEGCSCRLFQVTEDPKLYEEIINEYAVISPILRITPRTIDALERICSSIGPEDMSALVRSGDYSIMKDTLVDLFSNAPERLAFECESEREDFYNKVGYQYVKWPFSLAARSLGDLIENR